MTRRHVIDVTHLGDTRRRFEQVERKETPVTINARNVLLLLSILLFVLAAFGVSSRVALYPLGLACMAAALILR
jgi:hypothetical protein